ncbi:MAG: ATP synthase subunit I [Azoarcus sp.]
MNEFPELILSLGVGLLLGAIFFFGGLWWTLRRAVSSPSVALWLIASMLLRTGIVCAGLLWVCGSDWKRWLAGVLGFLVARLIATRIAPAPVLPTRMTGESRYAP